MSRAQAAQIVPGILARRAGHIRGGSAGEIQRIAPRPWIDAVERALGPGTSARGRLAAAQTAVSLARGQNLGPARTGFSYYALGRIALGKRSELALASFLTAAKEFTNVPNSGLHQAHIGVQMAAFALSAGQTEAALEVIGRHEGAAYRAQNAALLSTLLMMKAEALSLEGRASEARKVQVEALGWAQYGFGSQAEIWARLRDIAAVAPDRKES